MGSPRWTEEEMDYLRTAAKEETSSAIAQHLHRSVPAVQQKCKQNGITLMVGATRKRWSVKDVFDLYGFAEKYTLQRTARRLGRTLASVKKKASNLNISFRDGRLTLRQVADLLGVSHELVIRRRDKLGLSFRTHGSALHSVSDTRGASGDDIAAIARDMLAFPPGGAGPTKSAKQLRSIVAEYEGADG